MVPLSGYAKGCKTLETVPLTGVAALERNVTVLASDGTTVVSRLVSVRSPSGSNVTARDTERPRTVDVTHAESQVLYRGTRFDESFNYPYWNSTAPQKISAPEGWAERWRADESTLPLPGAVVKMMHPDGWGSWAFEVSSHDAGEGTLSFGRGGWQEAEGGDGCGAMYVENVRGELDAPGEWWFDDVATTLYFMPPAGWTEEQLQGAAVVAPRLQRAIEVSGDASDKLVEDLVLQDLNVTHTAITYLEPYEAPSGGDWSVHRGAALFVDGAERLTLRRLSFDQVDGNAVFFSGLVRNSSVEDCDFWRAGESAMLVVGSVPAGGDARVLAGARLPMNNTFTGNWVEEVGVHVKQTSCFFKSMAGGNLLQGNVCYNGPRAGFNWNDGLPGGDVLEHNVIFNMVRETGDHGTFNSWDRKEFVYDCPGGGGVCFTPQTIRLRHNMFIGPAGWNVDHDDGSSQYEDFSNVVYLGGIKYRDGVMRNMTGNLLVDAVPAFQVIGFDTDYFIGNTIASATPVVSQVCGPSSLGGLRGTTYATVSGAQEGAASAGSGGADAAQSAPCHARGPGWRPPACQCDAGTNVTVTAARLRAMLRATVGGAAAGVEGEAVLLV
ncbi:unnamed protein product [Prorocentrum cordatum]|nr:unnamed protein product [Polarella glacialis]